MRAFAVRNFGEAPALRTENSVSAPVNESSALPERTERTPNTLPSRPR